MSQDCLFAEAPTRLSRNLRHWAIRWRDLSLSKPPTLVQRTSESECSFWPTVRSHEVGEYQNQKDGSPQPTLTGAVKNWGTPRIGNGGSGRDRGDNRARLEDQAHAFLWATPSASLVQDGETLKSAMQWPTPIAHNERGSRGRYCAMERKAGDDLQTITELWPSPAERDYRSPNAKTYQERSGATKGEQLPNFVEHHFHSPLDPEPSTSGPTCWCGALGYALRSHRRRLNPFFVNWLMGWPLFWTAKEPMPFAPQGMASFHSNARWLLSRLFTSPGSAEQSSESAQYAQGKSD